ncbi:MAG: DUF4307 domain-containing protein [Microbacteriaceae bacterium]
MTSLDERYGTGRRSRRPWWIAGIAVVTVLTAVWLVWVNFSVTSIGAQDVTHLYNPDSRTMNITWNVTVNPGTDVSCALQVLNEQFQVVGWKVVDIPGGTEHTRQFNEDVRTAMTPNTGLVYGCWAS